MKNKYFFTLLLIINSIFLISILSLCIFIVVHTHGKLESASQQYEVRPSDLIEEITIGDNYVLTQYFRPGGNVTVPEGIVSIGTGAFNGNRLESYSTTIDSVYLPDSVMSIERGAFTATTAKSIRLSSSISYIGEYAFANSNSIELIYFDDVPQNNIIIERNAFANSPNVELLNFPQWVEIGDDGYLVREYTYPNT